MRKIEAVIQPGRFEEVRAALEAAGYPGITVTEVRGHGKQKGITHNWLGKKFKTEMIDKIKLEVVVVDSASEKLLKAILAAAYTGQTGDGKIFVLRIERAYKISSGEEGDGVVS